MCVSNVLAEVGAYVAVVLQGSSTLVAVVAVPLQDGGSTPWGFVCADIGGACAYMIKSSSNGVRCLASNPCPSFPSAWLGWLNEAGVHVLRSIAACR